MLAIEVKENHNIYHSVYSFTSLLKVKVDIVGVSLLRRNLDFCLLGAAEQWYTNELGHLARQGLRNETDGIKEWCSARHLIEASANTTIIYKNHSAAVELIPQNSLNTISVEEAQPAPR